ncbi:MAG: DUF559 domain-containing protein [Solirubrobacteraceae bacterium]|nr:DUF559 domain-containing protein [Solirubrobacteraceae bacterium]
MPEAEWRRACPEALPDATRQCAAGARPDVRLAELAAEQGGAVATRQLVGLGLDGRAIHVRVQRGQLHRCFHGVYAVGHSALSLTGHFAAAVLACGDGAILMRYAAASHLAMLAWEERDVDVATPRGRGRGIPGIRAHRCRIDPRDIWTRGNVRVTSPARTILDLAATMAAHDLRRLVRQAQAERHVNVRALLEILSRSRGHRGAAKLRALIVDGPTPTRSVLEDHALELILHAGIERPEVNPKLSLDGRSIEPDLLWRRQRLVVECDGRRWHGDPLAQRSDAARQAILEAHGHRVLRITWEQVVNHPQQTLARIRAALAPSP